MHHPIAALDRPSREALTRAAADAQYAPSILNTQPWRWRVEPDRLELFAERSRQLMVGRSTGIANRASCPVMGCPTMRSTLVAAERLCPREGQQPVEDGAMPVGAAALAQGPGKMVAGL